MAKDTKSSTPVKDSSAIPQHKRMAMGLPINGGKVKDNSKPTRK